MLLVVNIGNSNLRFALYEKSALVASVRLRSDRNRTADDIAALLIGALMAQGKADALAAVSAVCVSSVVPPLGESVREMCARCLQGAGEPLFITGATDTGMPVRYEPPGSLGADRVVNAYAARALYGAPVIVVDYGTATTFEAVDADGVYRGGAILPGVATGRDALAERTAQLMRLELDAAPPLPAIGTSTAAAMRSGLLLGAASVTEGMVARFAEEMGVPDPHVVATGGLAAAIARHTAVIDSVAPDLTIQGLRLLYHHLRPQ